MWQSYFRFFFIFSLHARRIKDARFCNTAYASGSLNWPSSRCFHRVNHALCSEFENLSHYSLLPAKPWRKEKSLTIFLSAFRELRSLVIDMVLATDMSSHFQQIKTMKSLLTNPNEFSVDKSKALSLVLHCCDISHPAKDWNIHRRWTELLLEEFFRQVSQ